MLHSVRYVAGSIANVPPVHIRTLSYFDVIVWSRTEMVGQAQFCQNSINIKILKYVNKVVHRRFFGGRVLIELNVFRLNVQSGFAEKSLHMKNFEVKCVSLLQIQLTTTCLQTHVHWCLQDVVRKLRNDQE